MRTPASTDQREAEHASVSCAVPLFKRYQPLSQQVMTARLHDYALAEQELLGQRLQLDSAGLAACVQHFSVALQLPDDLIAQLSGAVHQMAMSTDSVALIEAVNRLCQVWVDLYAEGLDVSEHALLSQLFSVRQWYAQSHTIALRQFLAQLFLEAASRYDRNALEYARRHHQLSGLPNSHLLLEQLQQVLLFSKAEVGLLLISFKLTSTMMDGHRHRMPALAAEIIRRLQHTLPADHTLYHLDSYEFAVLSRQLGQGVKLDLLSARLRQPFELTVHVNHQVFAVSPVIGGVCRQEMHAQAEEMLAQARLALEHADDTYQPFVAYSESLHKEAGIGNQLRLDVLEAFESDRLSL